MKNLIRVSLIFIALLFVSVDLTAQKGGQPQVKNVILMIGDGMGLAHVAATSISQDNKPLNLERAHSIGLTKTHSATNRVTDSAASGTAIATGTKTYNGAIGLDANKQPVESILEKAEKNGLATGLVATYSITHATPASFIAHVESRRYDEQIAEFFLKTDIDLFIGGGKKFFTDRKDGRNLTQELEKKGYKMAYTMDDVVAFDHGRLGALLAPNAMPTIKAGRGDFLPKATQKALDVLKKNSDKGFFVMIEGSMIDEGGHSQDIKMVIDETIDFDNAVKVAFDFADRNPGTLVIVTADHETGGLSIPSASPNLALSDQEVSYNFSTNSHTAVFVPIYAYGAGAENFSRFMDNTEISKIVAKLLKLK